MGGSLSELGTFSDMFHEILFVAQSQDARTDVGWHTPHIGMELFDLHHVVNGLTHVDDALIFSKAYYCDCLH